MDPLLQSFLADRDQPCPTCNYNLRGLTTDTCPECRAPIVLGILGKLPQPKLAWFVGAVLALGALLYGGYGCLMIGAIFFTKLGTGQPYWRVLVFSGLVNAACGAACGVSLFRLLARWKRPALRERQLSRSFIMVTAVLGLLSAASILQYLALWWL